MWSWPQLQKRLLLTYDFTGTVECIHTHTHREPTCPGRHLYLLPVTADKQGPLTLALKLPLLHLPIYCTCQ